MPVPGDIPFEPPVSPRRIPKLQVRHRIEGLPPHPSLQAADDITPVSNFSPTLTPSPTLPTDSRSTNGPSPPPRPSYPASPSPNGSYYGRSSNASPDLPAPQTKKRSSVFGFLSMKEPSTSAWESYVEEQKKQAALKGAKSVGLTDKKLPPTVPKVNSKWDGMPNIAHERGKSSMDLSLSGRPSFARPGSQRSESSKTSGSTAHSSGSKTSRRAAGTTSSQSTTSSFGTSRHNAPARPSVSIRTPSDTTVRVGPAMSTESFQRPSPAATEQHLPRMESMPEISLFFPPEHIPRQTPLHVLQYEPPEYDATERDTPTPRAEALSLELSRPETPKPVAPMATTTAADVLQDQSSEVPNMVEDSRSDRNSPYSPPTPLDILPNTAPVVETRPVPAPKHFRSVDDIPQWPLPTKPEDVIIETPAPPIPPKSLRRESSSSSIERLRTVGSQSSLNSSSVERLPTVGSPTSLDGAITSSTSSPTHSPRPRSPTNPTSPQQPTFDTPLAISPLGPPRIRSLYNPYGLRAPPAFLPGRVVTKDSDLATIPESDTASMRNSLLLAAPPLDRDSNDPVDSASVADSATSSEMSAQWYLSPRERLGLGGFLKHSGRNAPWPLIGNEDGGFVFDLGGGVGTGAEREVAGAAEERRGSGKKHTLISVFKR